MIRSIQCFQMRVLGIDSAADDKYGRSESDSFILNFETKAGFDFDFLALLSEGFIV